MYSGEKWEEEVYINKGGYSEVFRVRVAGRDYALKKIHSHIVKNELHREVI